MEAEDGGQDTHGQMEDMKLLRFPLWPSGEPPIHQKLFPKQPHRQKAGMGSIKTICTSYTKKTNCIVQEFLKEVQEFRDVYILHLSSDSISNYWFTTLVTNELCQTKILILL